jgi:hypothetical protein
MALIETFGHRASVCGYVRDASSNAGLGGAPVELVAEAVARTNTRIDGFYAFLNLPDGSYTLRAAAPAMGSRYGTVIVTGVAVSRDGRGRPVLDPKGNLNLPPTRLTGLVRRSDTLAPIAFADVRLRASNVNTKSNKVGQYAVSAIEAGTQTVLASAPGFAAASRVVTLSAGQETVADFSLTPG